MTDALERLVGRVRSTDPEFGVEYDRLTARHAFIVPIVEARKARGWSQRDLAAAAAVQQPVIARLESGDTDSRLSTITKLAHALDLRVSWIASA